MSWSQSLKVSLHIITRAIVVVVWAHFQPHLQLLLCTNNYSQSWRMYLTSTIVRPVGAIHKVETNNLWIIVESVLSTLDNRLLQILSHIWPWISLHVSHNDNRNQTRTNFFEKRETLQASQLLPTTPRIIVGQGEIRLWLSSNAPYFSSSLKK